MAVVTFVNQESKETGQTISIIGLATYMAIEHNYKILIIPTGFKDIALEECFIEQDNTPSLSTKVGENVKVGVESGVESLARIMIANKTNPEIVKNYSKIILRDRLDILKSSSATEYRDYENISANYTEIIQLANKYYDIVFVDLSKKMPDKYAKNIIQISDIIVMNLTQRLKNIDDFMELREKNEFYKRKNIMLLVGRYDAFSKYNAKNITRYLKERTTVGVIPYNTLYFEACSEGKIIDFFLRLKNIDENDRNYLFVKETTNVVDSIIYRLQELQMKL